MPAPEINVGFGTPFEVQVNYLRQKLALPTQRWDDIQGRAHDRAFVVAGAAKADLLADLHQAVIQAASEGRGLAAFRKDFKAIVAKNGWTGWTGEGSKEGEAWRTRVIYQTNMASSYAAGRHAQMSDPEVLKLHPTCTAKAPCTPARTIWPGTGSPCPQTTRSGKPTTPPTAGVANAALRQ
jgi:hypothetical protein